MLIDKGVTSGEVVTIKIISGAELIAKLIDETPTSYKFSKPMVVNVSPQGISLMPYVLSVDPEKTIEITKNNVCLIASTDKQFSDGYTQNTTGIALA